VRDPLQRARACGQRIWIQAELGWRLLASPSAFEMGANHAQAVGVIAVGAWTLVTAGLVFAIVKATIGLRVSAAEEESGLDVGEHGMEAYPEFTGGRDPFGLHSGPALSGNVPATVPAVSGAQPMPQTRPASEQR